MKQIARYLTQGNTIISYIMKNKNLLFSFIFLGVFWKQHLKSILLTIIALVITVTVLTLFVSWDDTIGKAMFINFYIGLAGEPREYALQFVFYDYFLLFWALIFFFLLPFKVLTPLTMSYTVSNSLWLRMTTVKWEYIQLARVFYVMSMSILIFCVGMFWAILFSFYQNLPFKMLFEAVFSLSVYTVFSGSIILLLRGSPIDSVEKRQTYVMISLLIPIALYILAKNLSPKVYGLLPFTFPLRANQLSYVSLRGNFMALLLALLFLLFPLLNQALKTKIINKKDA